MSRIVNEIILTLDIVGQQINKQRMNEMSYLKYAFIEVVEFFAGFLLFVYVMSFIPPMLPGMFTAHVFLDDDVSLITWFFWVLYMLPITGIIIASIYDSYRRFHERGANK